MAEETKADPVAHKNDWALSKDKKGECFFKKGIYAGQTKPEKPSDIHIPKDIFNYKTALKGLTDDDLNQLRLLINKEIVPQPTSYSLATFMSKIDLECFQYVAGFQTAKTVLQRVGYHAKKKELAVTNGYMLLIIRSGVPVYSRSGTFDIMGVKWPKKKNQWIPMPVWFDDTAKYPDYNKILPQNTISFEWKITTPIRILLKALSVNPSDNYGVIHIHPEMCFYHLQYGKASDDALDLGFSIPGITPVIVQSAYLYNVVRFLTNDVDQTLTINQIEGNDVQALTIETADKMKTALLMPLKP